MLLFLDRLNGYRKLCWYIQLGLRALHSRFGGASSSQETQNIIQEKHEMQVRYCVEVSTYLRMFASKEILAVWSGAHPILWWISFGAKETSSISIKSSGLMSAILSRNRIPNASSLKICRLSIALIDNRFLINWRELFWQNMAGLIVLHHHDKEG